MKHIQDGGAFLAESRRGIRVLEECIANAPDVATAAAMREELDKTSEADRAEYERLAHAQKTVEMEEQE